MNRTCKKFEKELTDLVLTPGANPPAAAVAHMKACPPCSEVYSSFQMTFNLLDTWEAPQPTPYFNQKLAVRIREEQAAPIMGWLETLMTRLQLNTGRNFRPAVVAALSFALAIGGGSVVLVTPVNPLRPIQASATLTDLQILDRNEQAFQQMDELQQDEDNRSKVIQNEVPVAAPIT